MPLKLVQIIILNWNKTDLTLECLDFLNQSNYKNIIVTLLDNGSKDNSLSLALKDKKYFFQVDLILSQVNLGFAGGVNFATHHIQNKAWDYVLLLNNDTKIFSDTIGALVDAANSESSSIIGGSTYNENNKLIFSGGRWPRILFGMKKSYPFDEQKNMWPSDYAEGSCTLISREILSDRLNSFGNLFNNNFFLYCEDLEFGIWASQRGYNIYISETAKTIHPGSESSGGQGNPLSYYYITRNRILLANQRLSPLWLILFHLWTIPSRSILLLIHIIKRRWHIVKPVFKGIWDGYLNKTGPKR